MKRHKKFLLSTLLAGVLALGVVNTVAPVNEVEGSASTVPAPIELVEGSHVLRNKLNTDKKSVQGDVTFSSIRIANPTAQNGAADSNWWGWPSLYLGVTDEETLDLSTATSLSLKMKFVGGVQPWIKWRAVDSDGDVIRVVDYSNDKGTYTKFDGTTTAVDPSGDFRGTYIIAPGMLNSNLANGDYVFTNSAGDGIGNGSFDWSKVASFVVSIHAWDNKTFDVGTLTATIGGEEVVLWDAENAVQKTYAQVFEGESTKTAATMNLNKDEWFFGAQPANVSNDPVFYADSSLNITATYTKADRNVLEFTKTANSVEHSWTGFYVDKGVNVPAVEQNVDLTNYDGIAMDVDLTGVNGTSEVCFFIKASNMNYRSWGHAYLLADNGTVTTNVAGDKIPAGFKGRAVLTFDRFLAENKSGAKLTDDINYDEVTAIGAIVSVGGNQVGDVAKFSNVQIVAEAQKEAAVISNLTTFKAGFTMKTGAAVRVSDPSGLRFGAKVTGAAWAPMYEALAGVAHEFGTVIVPNEAAYENARPNQAGILTVKKVASGDFEGTDYCWYAAIVEINEANYDRDFIAKAYLQYTVNGKTFTVWANGSTGAYSVYDVAKAAVESGVTDNEYINGIIATVEAN